MANTPTHGLVTNGINPTATTGWTTTGTVTISTNRFRLAAGASISQTIVPPTLPSELLIEVIGEFVDPVLPGEHPAQLILKAMGNTPTTRIIPLPETVGGKTFSIVTKADFTFDAEAELTWQVSIASTQPVFISKVQVTAYTDTALEEAKEEIAEDVERRYVEFSSDLDGIRYTVGVNKQAAEDGIEDLRTSFSVEATGIRAEITANKQYTDGKVVELSNSITATAEGLQADLNNKTTNINGQITTINSTISVMAGDISSKASTTTVNNLGTRVTTAEQNISSINGTITQKVSYTDYNGQTITSMINQDAWGVKIVASKIQLVGAVSVLSDITGNLGTIHSGNINIAESATIGTTLQIGQDWQSSYSKAIRFAGQYGSAGIAYSGGYLTISSLYGITLDADTISVLGSLNATVSSANYASSAGSASSASTAGNVGGYTFSHSGKNVTVRYNGAYIGIITTT